MKNLIFKSPRQVIHALISPSGYVPNNTLLPFLLYKEAIYPLKMSVEKIKKMLELNQWVNSWVDGIYDYHHYHSNTHESLVILQGRCQVQIGGEQGSIYEVDSGDVIILPAGVSHKNVGSSTDFKCLGSYPSYEEYDIKYGKAEEHPLVDENIKNVGIPKSDPLYGTKGILFDYWR